jgi:branched-chain amino acid transport system ATP-binding protein
MAIMRVENLKKSFGGVTATNDVTFALEQGETLGFIGPNGAGKTTLVAQLIGELHQDSGHIWFMDQEISQFRVPERVHLGIARTFQITTVLRSFTVEDNVALAVQAKQGHSFRFWRSARRDPDLRKPARAVIEQVGLGDFADATAAELSHGQQRQLELAIALATEPKVLLLDEPLAGMSGQDALGMVALLKTLKSKYTILLIEHDMDAVFDLADRIMVLVQGEVLASDVPEKIRNHPGVREAYLGDEASSQGATHA